MSISNIILCSSEEADEAAEEDELHEAGVAGEHERHHGGRRLPERSQQGAVAQGEADAVPHKEVVQGEL